MSMSPTVNHANLSEGDTFLRSFLEDRDFYDENLDPGNLGSDLSPGGDGESSGDDSGSLLHCGTPHCTFLTGDKRSWEKLCFTSKSVSKKL
jgi:hypothetical protein